MVSGEKRRNRSRAVERLRCCGAEPAIADIADLYIFDFGAYCDIVHLHAVAPYDSAIALEVDLQVTFLISTDQTRSHQAGIDAR